MINYIKLFTIFIIILQFEYLAYLNCNRDISEKKIWIPPMMGLLNNVVFTVNHLVTLYFYTFQYCFGECLLILNSLIYGYYHLLEILIIMFLHFPTNIISIFGLGISLYFIDEILKTILNRKSIKN